MGDRLRVERPQRLAAEAVCTDLLNEETTTPRLLFSVGGGGQLRGIDHPYLVFTGRKWHRVESFKWNHLKVREMGGTNLCILRKVDPSRILIEFII